MSATEIPAATETPVKALPTWKVILEMVRFRPWLMLVDLLSVVIARVSWQLAPGLIMREFFNMLTGEGQVIFGMWGVIAMLLGAFLGRVSKGAGTRAVVFVPARPGPWIQRVAAAARGPGGAYPRVDFVVCTDGIGERQHRSRLARAALSPPEEKQIVEALQEDLIAVVDALAQTGANVLVVDRPGGRLVHGRNLRGVQMS